MKTNQKNSGLGVQARPDRTKVPGEKKKAPRSIEQEISTIFDLIVLRAPHSILVVNERPKAGSSCKGIICLYSRSDLKRQSEEEAEYRRLINLGADKTTVPTPFKAVPSVKYAFYPSVYDASRIGSVAIYGENAVSHGLLLQKHPVLFGYSVKSATVEMGVRPFVSVKLR